MQFQEMNLSESLQKAISANHYQVPTPIQQKTIPLALTGQDILGCAQTGTGKTAAFVLPILQRLSQGASRRGEARALILAPTRELALQNYETVRLFEQGVGLRSAVIFGGVSQNRQVSELQAGVDVLVATPGRLLDLIGQGIVSLDRIEIFVLDEADRMLDMGFVHDVKRIVAKLPARRQTMLFSATMPPEVERLAMSLLKNPATVKVDPVTSTVDKIRQVVYFVERENKKQTLLHLLKEKGVSTALVFVRTKGNADQIVRILRRENIQAMAIHGDKSQNARERALASFKSGEISVLAATDIAARGIDISGLPYVINYNIPEEAETYIHRIGRTGRAGMEGTAISICASDELNDWRDIEKLTNNHIPAEKCPWSVENMQPTAKPPKQPRPPRKDRTAEKAGSAAPIEVRSPAGKKQTKFQKSPVGATGTNKAHRRRRR